jgi:hypothetical protein
MMGLQAFPSADSPVRIALRTARIIRKPVKNVYRRSPDQPAPVAGKDKHCKWLSLIADPRNDMAQVRVRATPRVSVYPHLLEASYSAAHDRDGRPK